MSEFDRTDRNDEGLIDPLPHFYLRRLWWWLRRFRLPKL